MKRFMLIAILTVISGDCFGAELSEKQDTNRLLSVARSESIDAKKALEQLTQEMHEYVKKLPIELQKLLDWDKQFALFEKRVELLKDFIILYGSNIALNEIILTALGVKPISSFDMLASEYEQLLEPTKSMQKILQPNSFVYESNRTLTLYNLKFLFPFSFIEANYPKEIKLSPHFEKAIKKGSVDLSYWVKQLKQEEHKLLPDDQALLYGYQPRSFDKKLDILASGEPFDPVIFKQFLAHKKNFRLLMIPGVVFFDDQTAYMQLYSYSMEYMLTSAFGIKEYLLRIAQKITQMTFNAGRQDQKLIAAFITQNFAKTSVMTTNFMIKFKDKQISKEELLIFMGNFLENLKKNLP